ncbi:MAG: hypothetical protein JRI23_01285 [Deltaproteobacteria bacterium]|jgi:hypothetical protein|nr:hypothetical protein [Deltaproteobacteria bacterium]MBW2530088.1 hypothetical protein [Deltaproteobacteria bacterium]
MFRDQPWSTFRHRFEHALDESSPEDSSSTSIEQTDAVEWVRQSSEVSLGDRRWRARTRLALQSLHDSLVQKDVSLGSISGWQRESMADQIAALRRTARSSLVRIGVLLAGMTELDPRDVEHALVRLGDDVARFLAEEQDVALRLESARRAELGPMQDLVKIGV